MLKEVLKLAVARCSLVLRWIFSIGKVSFRIRLFMASTIMNVLSHPFCLWEEWPSQLLVSFSSVVEYSNYISECCSFDSIGSTYRPFLWVCLCIHWITSSFSGEEWSCVILILISDISLDLLHMCLFFCHLFCLEEDWNSLIVILFFSQLSAMIAVNTLVIAHMLVPWWTKSLMLVVLALCLLGTLKSQQHTLILRKHLKDMVKLW